MVRSGEVDGRSGEELGKAYRRGINKGLYKILLLEMREEIGAGDSVAGVFLKISRVL
jgi:hypothetical protein